MNEWRAALASLPKAELHVHLEGTLTAALRARLAGRHQVTDPLAGIDVVARSDSFPGFARLYGHGLTLLRTSVDFADAVDDYLAQVRPYGVRHVEFAVDVQTHHRRGVPLGGVVDGVTEGFQRWHSRDVSGGMIATFDRNDPASAPDVLRELRPYRDRILGIGLAADERSADRTSFGGEFALAGEWGWGRTTHAVAPEAIDVALDVLRVDRVDHGFRAGERPDLVKRLVDEAVALAACPQTNVLIGPVHSLRDHPLPALIRQGVAASLSTDDPAYFGCALDTVYESALDELALTRDELLDTVIASVDTSFATEQRKSELHMGIAAWRAAHLPADSPDEHAP
jgi:adenosine deaminase